MHTVSGSISLAVRRSFHLSLTVLSTIGHRLVFSLGRWSSRIQPGFHVSRPTRGPHRLAYSHFAYGTLTLCGRTFQYRSAMLSPRLMIRPHNPRPGHPVRVWAIPFSLAATLGISIDFCSSRYLDVSVPWVGSPKGDGIGSRRVPPFGHPRILACLQLPEAFRSLPRPSSPVCAKASTVRTCSLDQPSSVARARMAVIPPSVSGAFVRTGPLPSRLSNTYAPPAAGGGTPGGIASRSRKAGAT